MILNAILILALCGSAAALLVALARLREEKEKRWDEISRAAGLENELERSKAREKCSAEVVLWHNKQVALYGQKNKALQDRLSSVICPRNNHVWRNGVCAKCGRVKQ